MTEFDLRSGHRFGFVFFFFETIIKTNINCVFFFVETIKKDPTRIDDKNDKKSCHRFYGKVCSKIVLCFFFYVVGDKMTEIFETLPVKRMYFVFFFLNPYLKSKKNISDNYDNKYGVNINIYFMYI
jgi:hypothetical protein